MYFLLAVLLLAVVFFAPVRSALTGAAQRWNRRSRMAARAWTGAGQRGAANATASMGEAWRAARHWTARHMAMVVGALLLITGLPLTAAVVRAWFPVSSYDHRHSRAVDPQVAELLRGEGLVPPQPLPPELFTTPEVEQARPLTSSASRQWELLDESFRQRLLLVFKRMREEHGYQMVLLEGYRSAERQATLAALGPSVTLAGPFESLHQHGLAADCAFIREGRIVISEADAWAMRGYEKYGEVARSVGLDWGGDWRSLKDYGHIELRIAMRSESRHNRITPSVEITVKED
jgi:peptidoglycan L-alanyl-D-glutamate endopeptidase CwlK